MAAPDPEHLARLYRDLFDVDARGQVVFEDLYRRFAARARKNYLTDELGNKLTG